MERLKNKIIVIEFFVVLLVVLILNIIKQDEKISLAERRKLASFPDLTLENIISGDFSENFEKYANDQFIAREELRKIKYLFNTQILNQKDNNKMFVSNNAIYKMEYPLSEEKVDKASKKMQKIYDEYLQGMNVYYSIIPDKNYYLEDEHLKLDYNKIEEIMNNNLKNMTYIDIKSTLNENSFYRTDLHWKQEEILETTNKIKKEMKHNIKPTQYTEKEAGKFYGVYYGQVGKSIKADTIKYLTNEEIENCTTYNYETKLNRPVHNLEKYKTSADKYDIFVSGPTALISINNQTSKEDKELLIFRDSFGSSLAPLMIDSYKKITLIDTRYISPNLLEDYIEFKDQDVLFIYSGIILNQNVN